MDVSSFSSTGLFLSIGLFICRIIHYYVLREQAGTLAPPTSDLHKVSHFALGYSLSIDLLNISFNGACLWLSV